MTAPLDGVIPGVLRPGMTQAGPATGAGPANHGQTGGSPAQGMGPEPLVCPPWPDPDGWLRAMLIPLLDRDGAVVATTIVDPDLYPALARWRWSVDERGYARRMIRLPGGGQRTLRMHRIIMCCWHGDGLLVDHINRSRLDNRRANLRFVTPGESARNVERLSGADRMADYLELLGKGVHPAQAAQRLGLSNTTIERHRRGSA